MMTGLAAVLMTAACSKEEKEATVQGSRQVTCTFKAGIKGVTKSTINATNVEDKLTNLMIAVYRDGSLFSWEYLDDAPETISLLLQQNFWFHIYTWANMGDLSGSLPYEEEEVASLPYRITSYSGINEDGFPMAMSFSFKPGTSTLDTILLERLFAKVTVNLNCLWPGGQLIAARLCNVNGKLLPFGHSAIQRAADVYDGGTEMETLYGSSASFVLYVPENLQGEYDSIEQSEDKTQDNNILSSVSSRLTYLEVDVEGSGLYQGTITYRNYLGNNATSSFDIERNTSYTWSIDYYENNLSKDDWKHSNDLTDTRYITSGDYIYVTPGQIVTLGDYLDSNLDLSVMKWTAVPSAQSQGVIKNALATNDLSVPNLIINPYCNGGRSASVRIEPQNNSTDGLRKTIELRVREPLNLNMTPLGVGAFPYRSLRFRSASTLTSEQAVTLCGSLNLELSNSNTLSGFQSWDYGYDSGGYYITLNLVPTMPGDYDCTATTSTGMERFSFTVTDPDIRIDPYEFHLNPRGYANNLSVFLTDSNGNMLQDGIYSGESSLELRTMQPYTSQDIYIGYTSDGGYGYQSTCHNYALWVNIPWALAGRTVPMKAIYTYPNGHSVNKTIDIYIDPS